jgi:hypothetical protein
LAIQTSPRIGSYWLRTGYSLHVARSHGNATT